MYVVPRPDFDEDPNFAVRIAVVVGLALVAMIILRPEIPVLSVVFSYTLISGQRKAVHPLGEMLTHSIMLVLIWIIASVVVICRPLPMLLLAIMFLLFTAGFYITRSSGTPLGMIVVLVSALMSVTGLKSQDLIFVFRDSMMMGVAVAMLLTPVVHWLFPANTDEIMERGTSPAWGYHFEGAIIRAVILMGLCFWLYAVLPPSDMMLAVAAIFVLMFPSRETAFNEARNRVVATFYGGIAAVVALWVIGHNGQTSVMILVLMLLALFFAHQMMFGYRDHTLYQYAFSVTLSLVIGALTTQSPASAIMTRVVLTMAGATFAAILAALLDYWILGPRPKE